MKSTLQFTLMISFVFLFVVAGCDDESKSNTNNVNNLNNLNNTNNVNNAVCGNGILETGEACDLDAFPEGTNCLSLGFTGGTISCAGDCTLDTTTCEGCVDACIYDESHCNIDGNAYDYCDLDTETGCTAWYTATCPEAFPMCEEPMGYANCYPTECVDECGEGEAMSDYVVGLGTAHTREGAIGPMANRLLEIEAELGGRAKFLGKDALKVRWSEK
ncbi:hypothetical protein KJ975_09655 [Myxococcota bacterium]|nr:hypothetical protein [Myxococcota bacterium]